MFEIDLIVVLIIIVSLGGQVFIPSSFFAANYLLLKMTLYDFNGLDVQDQADSLCEHGVFLSERQNDRYIILLYQIDGFYIEVYFNKGKGKIVRFRSFLSPDQLFQYLKKINIDALFKP